MWHNNIIKPMDINKISKPLPDPIQKGVNVSESLLNFLKNNKLNEAELISNIIKQRVEYGIKKYGQPLMSDDGRETQIDAVQELGDFLQYFWKMHINGEDTILIKKILSIINEICQAQ